MDVSNQYPSIQKEVEKEFFIKGKVIGGFLSFTSFPIDYEKYLRLLDFLTQLVRKDSNLKFFIFCNHTPLITNGRGDRQNSSLGNISKVPLGIEKYQINRGGGLTFHGPNQWIGYPILKLHAMKYPLKLHLDFLLNLVAKSLEEFNIEPQIKMNPLGVWTKDNKKLASAGVGIDHWVTQHGIALNLESLPFSENDISLMSPCGLNGNTYTYAKEINDKITLEAFQIVIENKIEQGIPCL